MGRTSNAATEHHFIKLDKHPACLLWRIFFTFLFSWFITISCAGGCL